MRQGLGASRLTSAGIRGREALPELLERLPVGGRSGGEEGPPQHHVVGEPGGPQCPVTLLGEDSEPLAAIGRIDLTFDQAVAFEAGHQVAKRIPSATIEKALLPATATILPLIALVLALSFSDAAARLDASRQTIVDEVNAIESVWRRIDIATSEARPRLADLVRRYTDARIRAYRAYADRAEYQRQVATGNALREELSTLAGAATPDTPKGAFLLSAINDVDDAATARSLSLRTHLPPLALGYLFGIVLVGALVVGMALAVTGSRQWFHRTIIAAVMTMIVYVIVDLEFPRVGPFQLLKGADAMLVELRRSMG